MRSGALLGLIAPHSLSNIELLVPLMMSIASEESDANDTNAASERYERAHVDKDTSFSNIPSSAFVLDESPSDASQKHKRGDKHNRKQDLAYRPRSIYLESKESAESDEQDERSEQVELGVKTARTCSRLMRTATGPQNVLLLLLCSELQDAAPTPAVPPALAAPPVPPASPAPPVPPASTAPSAPPAPPAPGPACVCCQQWLEPLMRARRGLVPIGENSYWRPHHMPNWDQE